MSDFVAECRREWKRLRVPDAVADEMAAELAADLSEAAAEGVPAEDLLGAGAADPRSFAASWAAERGVVQPRAAERRPRTGSLVLAAIGVLSAAALAAGVAILATPPATTSALPAPSVVFSPRSVWVSGSPDGKTIRVSTSRPPRIWVADPSTVSLANIGPRSSVRGSSREAIAWTLLIAGIVGIVVTALCWWRVGLRQSYA